jgi:hypothetical protein
MAKLIPQSRDKKPRGHPRFTPQLDNDHRVHGRQDYTTTHMVIKATPHNSVPLYSGTHPHSTSFLRTPQASVKTSQNIQRKPRPQYLIKEGTPSTLIITHTH